MIAPLLALFLVQQQPQGQARQTPAQTQTSTPAPAPPAPQAAPQGRGGRGGIAGPGPAIGGDVDETPVVTHHSVDGLYGKTLNYTATVAQMPLKNASGETRGAHLFYGAYTLDGQSEMVPSEPLTFCFNGGPGSASMWVHMGRHGSAKSEADVRTAACLSPPYKMIDNQDTWLDQTDLVFIDPVGTGSQSREEHRSGAADEWRTRRYPVGKRVHAHVHHA